MDPNLILKLKLDCNSLNAIAGVLRYNGLQKQSDVLLAIEDRLFDAIDILEGGSNGCGNNS